MPTNTTYNPQHVHAFEKSKLNANGHHAKGQATVGGTTNFDYVLTDDCMYTGSWFLLNGGTNGDTAQLQVIDTNGITGAPPGTVLLQGVDWGMPSFTINEQFDFVYPAKILATMTIRLVYNSVAALLSPAPYVIINHKLHKVLV